SVGDGIESTYDPDLDATNPEYASMLATLFTIADPAEYALALDQLSADQYAGYLRSLGWLGTRFNGLMNDMSECGKGIVHTELCRSPGDPRIWAEFNLGRVDTDGDVEASGFEADQMFIAIGIDMAVSEN